MLLVRIVSLRIEQWLIFSNIIEQRQCYYTTLTRFKKCLLFYQRMNNGYKGSLDYHITFLWNVLIFPRLKIKGIMTIYTKTIIYVISN